MQKHPDFREADFLTPLAGLLPVALFAVGRGVPTGRGWSLVVKADDDNFSGCVSGQHKAHCWLSCKGMSHLYRPSRAEAKLVTLPGRYNIRWLWSGMSVISLNVAEAKESWI